MKRLAVCALLACGGQPMYLGAELPAACEQGDVERCAGWMAERDLVAGQLDVYADPTLHAYVQHVANRLARGAGLARAPRIVIGAHDGTYAAFGERIVIGRMAIERLGSEAELAAIVAHELVHVEGRHASVSLFAPDADDGWLAARRDAEAVADERAVMLLEHAGYAPAAMPRALAASLELDDDEHPPRAERLAAVTTLAGRLADSPAGVIGSGLGAGRSGFEGRDELLRNIDGMIVGRDTRLGLRIKDAWVIATLGMAIDLAARDVVHIDGDALVLRSGRAGLTAYPIGSAWARELADTLDDSARAETLLGPLTVGVARSPSIAETPLAKLQRVIRELLPQPAPGTWVVVLARPRGGLVIEVEAKSDVFTRDRWLRSLRAASGSEILAAEPVRIAIRPAPYTAAIRELVAYCPDPVLALTLDDPLRTVASGAPFKCTNR